MRKSGFEAKQLRLKGGATRGFLLFAVLFVSWLPTSTKAQETPQTESAPANTPANTPLDRSRRTTNFEWDPISGAQGYEIEITPTGTQTKEPYRFNVKEARWDGELKPGNYKMRLRSKDRRGVPGQWSPPEEFYVKLYAPNPLFPLPGQEVKSEEDTTFDLKIKWAVQTEASKYQIHIEDESKTFSQNFEVSGSELSVKLPVARRYQWTIKGFDKLNNEGEPLDGQLTFTLLGKKLATPKIEKPETIYVRQLSWQPSPQAETYKYSLQKREKNRKWAPFVDNQTTATQIPFDMKWPGGQYKLTVYSEGNLRAKSNAFSIIFKVASGARTEAAERRALMRKSIDRTNDWYFIASYLITQIDYLSINVDETSSPSVSALGGTGRLGAGYLNARSPWGFLGIADLSGFLIEEKNYTYPSLEVHGIYRQALGSIGEMRLSTGLFAKQLPEIIGNKITQQFKLEQLSISGAHFGGEYWYSMNQKLGLQVNARIYYPLAGQTPSGGALVSEPSAQFGLLGSLRLNEVATGLMGYVYRKDVIKYKAVNPNAISQGYLFNETSITGHYLNFYLEWDL